MKYFVSYMVSGLTVDLGSAVLTLEQAVMNEDDIQMMIDYIREQTGTPSAVTIINFIPLVAE
jgi:hypothetical protein